MSHVDEEVIDENLFPDITDIREIKKRAKEDVLDEMFKKAETSKRIRHKPEDKVIKKPFLQLGVVLICITIISLITIKYLPWMFIKFDTVNGGVQELYYIDFKNKNDHYYSEIDNIFESPCSNCSNNSKNYIGIIKNDFSNIPKITSYIFIALAALGLFFTIFEIFRIKNKYLYDPIIIHTVVASASLFIGVIIMLLFIKFIGFYFLLFHNSPFIEISGAYNITLVFIVPIIIIDISLAIIIMAITVIKININEVEKKLISDKSHPQIIVNMEELFEKSRVN